MMGAAVLTNLPALLVVVPLLLAPFSALLLLKSLPIIVLIQNGNQ